MTKILAFADTQLGVSTVPLAEQRKVLDQIVQVALDREVDLVLHGGDVFEGPVVLPEHLRCFVDAMDPLISLRGIPTLMIRGNGRHDMAVRNVHALDILRNIDGFGVSDRPQGIHARGVNIITLPWVHPGSLIAHLNGHVDHDAVNLTASEMLVEIARRLRSKADLAFPTVLLAHWAISGSALPSGLPVDEMREPILPWADLDAFGFDLIIGAHIHQPQQISQPLIDSTFGVVLGSPQQLNFGESGAHGCWIFEVGEGDAAAEFVPIESPQFATFDVDLASYGMMEVRAGDYVRVRYTATDDEAKSVDHEALRRELQNAGAASVKIEPQIVRTARARAEGISEQLSQVEALAEWCGANDIGPDMQHRIIGRFQEWV